MTEMTEFRREHHRSRREARERYYRELTATAQVRVMFVLTAIGFYAAFTTFGTGWARLAGASGWEAAVWPVAATATTVEAFYCRIRFLSGWYPEWARWLFDAVAGAGTLLVGLGIALYSGGYPHQLNHAAKVIVNATPGYCLVLSIVMTATFVLTQRPLGFSNNNVAPRLPLRLDSRQADEEGLVEPN